MLNGQGSLEIFNSLQQSGKSQGILKSSFNSNCSNPSKIEQTNIIKFLADYFMHSNCSNIFVAVER